MRGKIYFKSTNAPYGTELWVYDPEEDNVNNKVRRLTNINETGSSHPEDLTVMNGKLYFRATNGKDGSELWRYNPDDPITLNANPIMLKNISNGNNSSMPDELTEINGKLYFVARNTLNQSGLWVYDPAKPTKYNSTNSFDENSNPRKIKYIYNQYSNPSPKNLTKDTNDENKFTLLRKL